MPTYEYACAACKHEWEIEQKISADPIKKCPKCGKNKAVRQIGSGNFILKGGGWYADAYSSSSNKPAAKKDDSSTKSESTSSSDSSASSDSATTTDSSTSSKDSSAKNDAPAKAEPKSKKKPAKSD
jgi:putative FmdB family regulatory protein